MHFFEKTGRGKQKKKYCSKQCGAFHCYDILRKERTKTKEESMKRCAQKQKEFSHRFEKIKNNLPQSTWLLDLSKDTASYGR